MKNENLDYKAIVSPSVPLNCSADGVGENAERALLEQMNCVYNEMLQNSKPDDPEIARITSECFWEMFDSE